MTDEEALAILDDLDIGLNTVVGVGRLREWVIELIEQRDNAVADRATFEWEVSICTLAQTRGAIEEQLASCSTPTCPACVALTSILAVLTSNDDAALRPDEFGLAPSAIVERDRLLKVIATTADSVRDAITRTTAGAEPVEITLLLHRTGRALLGALHGDPTGGPR